MEAAENKGVTGRLNVLTATRGIAAMLIVIFHFGLEVFPFSEAQRFFSKGNMAVSYFFTLSGFIMCYTYYNHPISFKTFITKRLARIVPVYWLAILLSLFTIADRTNLFTALGLNVLFLQSYIPGYALTINSPGWSLSVEVFFYLLFPFLLKVYKLYPKRFLIASILFYIVSQIVHLFLVKDTSGSNALHELVYYHPLGHLNSFVIGMGGYYVFNTIKTWRSAYTILLIVCTIAVLVWMPYSKHNGMLAPLFVLLIIGLSKQSASLLTWKPIVLLGEISYGLYILQMPVFIVLADINNAYLHISYSLFFFLYIALLTIAAGITYYVIEQPARMALSAYFKAQKK